MVAIAAPWVFIFAAVSAAVLPGLVRAQLGSFAVAFAGVATGTTLLMAVVVQAALRPWVPKRSATFGLVLGSFGLACGVAAVVAQSPAGALAASVLLGCGYGGCLIAGLRFIEATTSAETRGRLTGIYYTITYVGFASPLALATLAKHVGDVGSLLVTLACAVLSLIAMSFAGASRRVTAPPVPDETYAQRGGC
jgi:hypothetical protein